MYQIGPLGLIQANQAFRGALCTPIAVGVYSPSHKLLTPAAQVGRP
jgi:hypothetical protein